VYKLNKASSQIIKLDANHLAREAGSLLTANIVMLGALFGTQRLPIKIETVKESIENN